MTTTEKATTAPDAAPADWSGVEFAVLDPHTLVIGANVRDTADLEADPEFVPSIRELGVLQPILAVLGPDGAVIVRDGQCRTLAAQQVGLTAVPVLIRPTGSDWTNEEIARLSEQLNLNDRRTEITEGQRAKAVADMLDLGVPVTEAARRTRVKKTLIADHGKVGASAAARRLLDEGEYTLDHAAVLGEFEEAGDVAAVQTLLDTPSWNFHRVAQTITAARAVARARDAASEEYAERGFVVLDQEPAHGPQWLIAADVRDGAGGPLDPAALDPALWQVWLTAREQKGARGADPDQAVHIDVEYWITRDDLEGSGLTLSADAVAADIARAGRGAAGLTAEEEAKNAERDDRQRVKVLNAAGVAASAVRKEFVTTLCARKAPKGTTAWLAGILAADGSVITEGKGYEVLAEILPTDADKLRDASEWATDARATMLILAQVLAGLEARMSSTGKDWWRTSRMRYTSRDGFPRGARTYLEFLETHGYPLAPVEQIVTAATTVDAAYDIARAETQ